LKQPLPEHTGRIARAAGSISVAVFLSRILGLVREQVFAGLFGAGYAIDAFVVAFRIPNLLRDLFAEGALSSAFVTVFTQYSQQRGPEQTWRLANNVIVTFTLVVGGLSFLGILLSPELVHLMAPDFGLVAGKLELTATMTRIMFPFLLLVSLASVAMGILNTQGKFFVPALASSFFNLGSIVVGVSLALLLPRFGVPAIVGMAWGTLVGGLLQLLIQTPLLWRVGYTPRLVCDWRDEGLRQVFRLMLPAVVGLSASQINIFINTFYAASCEQGSVSWLNYAYRLVHLPQGLFGVALSVATLPLVSRLAAQRETQALKEAFRSSLSLAMLLTIPAAAGLIALAEPICAVIFQHGRFTAWDTHQTAAALTLYALGLFAFAGVKILVPVFYALNDTRIPVLGSFLTVIANFVCLNLTLTGLAHRAIALSTSVSMWFNLLFLMAMLYRKVAGYPLAGLLATLGKITGAAFLMAVGVRGAYLGSQILLGHGLAGQVFSLAGAILLGVVLYLGLLWLGRVPELHYLLRQLRAGTTEPQNPKEKKG
jgi:putative peptidoglycan lipid II flippase